MSNKINKFVFPRSYTTPKKGEKDIEKVSLKRKKDGVFIEFPFAYAQKLVMAQFMKLGKDLYETPENSEYKLINGSLTKNSNKGDSTRKNKTDSGKALKSGEHKESESNKPKA